MSTHRAIKILIVDDDDGNRYFKTHVLSRAGYRVSDAVKGADALRQVESERPDVVLLDVKLPDMSGIEVCRHVKERFPSTVVLQTSAALTGPGDRAAGLEGGADSYLVEPLEPDELTAAVKALLRMRQAEQALRSLNETLEQRVAERTRELADAHRRLAAESEQRAKAEEALRHAQKLDAIGQLTGGVAHDFNNLLTVVIGHLDLAEQALAKPRRMAAHRIIGLLGGARRAALDCERLTRQLLAFARRDVLRTEVVDLNRIIAGFENLIRRAVGERVTVELSLDPGLWPCRIDPRQFEAAILNLAVNARDAMALGGQIEIKTGNCEIGTDAGASPAGATGVAPGAYARLSVADTGTGMTRDVLSRAFEPFFTTKDIGQGSGLGLSQVYGFVTQSGGHVTVDSTPGRGTSVQIFLPRSDERPEAALDRDAEAGELPGGQETILVVEDNAMVLELAVAMLIDLGYRVRLATDGRAALDILQGGDPVDLLFTDVVMPNRMSGVELAREAQRLRPGLKVLVTSGYSAHAPGAAPELGEFPLIAKPYRRADLAKRIRAALDR